MSHIREPEDRCDACGISFDRERRRPFVAECRHTICRSCLTLSDECSVCYDKADETRHKDILRINSVYLCENLNLTGMLLIRLLTRKIIQRPEETLIDNAEPSHKKVNKLIEYLSKRPTSDFYQFLEALCEDSQLHIVNGLKDVPNDWKTQLANKYKNNEASAVPWVANTTPPASTYYEESADKAGEPMTALRKRPLSMDTVASNGAHRGTKEPKADKDTTNSSEKRLPHAEGATEKAHGNEKELNDGLKNTRTWLQDEAPTIPAVTVEIKRETVTSEDSSSQSITLAACRTGSEKEEQKDAILYLTEDEIIETDEEEERNRLNDRVQIQDKAMLILHEDLDHLSTENTNLHRTVYDTHMQIKGLTMEIEDLKNQLNPQSSKGKLATLSHILLGKKDITKIPYMLLKTVLQILKEEDHSESELFLTVSSWLEANDNKKSDKLLGLIQYEKMTEEDIKTVVAHGVPKQLKCGMILEKIILRANVFLKPLDVFRAVTSWLEGNRYADAGKGLALIQDDQMTNGDVQAAIEHGIPKQQGCDHFFQRMIRKANIFLKPLHVFQIVSSWLVGNRYADATSSSILALIRHDKMTNEDVQNTFMYGIPKHKGCDIFFQTMIRKANNFLKPLDVFHFVTSWLDGNKYADACAVLGLVRYENMERRDVALIVHHVIWRREGCSEIHRRLSSQIHGYCDMPMRNITGSGYSHTMHPWLPVSTQWEERQDMLQVSHCHQPPTRQQPHFSAHGWNTNTTAQAFNMAPELLSALYRMPGYQNYDAHNPYSMCMRMSYDARMSLYHGDTLQQYSDSQRLHGSTFHNTSFHVAAPSPAYTTSSTSPSIRAVSVTAPKTPTSPLSTSSTSDSTTS